MNEIRKIIREELKRMSEGGLEDLPLYKDPKACIEYAMKWQGKAAEMNQFYWQVSDIIGAFDMSSEEKIGEIAKILPNYGWV